MAAISAVLLLLLMSWQVNSGIHSTLSDHLNIFDLNLLENVFNNSHADISHQCALHMDIVLQALREHKRWALKANDANGRYSSGFFWGNGYWVGSETLCLNIEKAATNYEILHSSPTTVSNQSKYDSDPAPFPLGFYKIRFLLTLPANISSPRTILLGLCLPLSCSKHDVSELISQQSIRMNVSAEIQRVKTPHEFYHYWQDPVFWTLCVTSTIIAIFLLMGTSLDYYQERREERWFSKCSSKNFINETGKTSRSVYNLQTEGLKKDAQLDKLDKNSNSVSLMTVNVTSESLPPGSHDALWQQLLLAFSVRRNLRTIWDQSVGEDTIPTVHGIRFLSMCWVVMGHTCIIIFKYSDNMEFRGLMEQEWTFQTITNSPFAVDSFFFISGLLVSYLYFRTTAKIDVSKLTGAVGFKSNSIQFFGLIIYRFCRLTSPYLFIIGCVQISMQYFEHNAVFDPPTNDHINCPKYWWRNALYINTLYPVEEMCMLWSWYLADDTQFYILGLVLLITAVSRFKSAVGLFLAFMTSSWFTTAYVAYSNNHKPRLVASCSVFRPTYEILRSLRQAYFDDIPLGIIEHTEGNPGSGFFFSHDDPLTLFDKIYDKPWTRLGPYLVGMAIGWTLFKCNSKIKMNKVTVLCGWVASIAGMMCLVYGLHGQDLSRLANSAYSSLSHTAWAMCLAWIVIACSTGYGGLINTLLSSSILYPFSRVTYCAYLVHPIVIRQMIIAIDSPLHLNQTFIFVLYLGVVSASYGLSFIVSLMFEAPIVSLLRLMSPKKKRF